MASTESISKKPTLIVDVEKSAAGALPALSALSTLKDGACFHELHDQRHPLGIYNMSTSRIFDKIKRCCIRLEKYWLLPPYTSELEKEHDLHREIADYLELSLYAAVEHVDDVDAIIHTFFKSRKEYRKSRNVKKFKDAVKLLRDRISSLANTIKHSQGRVNLYSMEFMLGDTRICLHGLFIEGFHDGAVRPHPIVHSKGEVIISVTSFLWSIMIFMWEISCQLKDFLESISVVCSDKLSPLPSEPFCDAIVALARLPLYALDEPHPFGRVRVVIKGGDSVKAKLQSNIYGSLICPWLRTTEGYVLGSKLMYEGDGVSRSFGLVNPKQIRISHWD